MNDHVTDDKCDKAIAYLNELLVCDRAALSSLCVNRVPCSSMIVGHESCQVWQVDKNQWTVGMMGVVNGLLQSIGVEQIAIVYETHHQHVVIRFERLDRHDGLDQHTTGNVKRKAAKEQSQKGGKSDSGTIKSLRGT